MKCWATRFLKSARDAICEGYLESQNLQHGIIVVFKLINVPNVVPLNIQVAYFTRREVSDEEI